MKKNIYINNCLFSWCILRAFSQNPQNIATIELYFYKLKHSTSINKDINTLFVEFETENSQSLG